jgi:hypothetical protein
LFKKNFSARKKKKKLVYEHQLPELCKCINFHTYCALHSWPTRSRDNHNFGEQDDHPDHPTGFEQL